MSAGAGDRLRLEDMTERYRNLLKAINGLADRIETALLEDGDRQTILEDALWNLDVLAGASIPRGVPAEGWPS